jgi:hypothetical protein
MVTNEQVNAILARSGLSIEGFEAFRKRKYGEQRKQTKEEWLQDFKTCSHCIMDGKCKHQHFGYHQEKQAVREDGVLSYNVNSLSVNMRTYPKFGSYRSCCHWDAETTLQLYSKVEELIKEGKVI